MIKRLLMFLTRDLVIWSMLYIEFKRPEHMARALSRQVRLSMKAFIFEKTNITNIQHFLMQFVGAKPRSLHIFDVTQKLPLIQNKKQRKVHLVKKSPFNFEANDILLLSIALGIYFLILQGYEYATVPFHLNDGIFGSAFYMLTGLHGLHVLVGVAFLSVVFLRNMLYWTGWSNTGLLCGTWYWHFVDIIWILLYITIYFIPYFL